MSYFPELYESVKNDESARQNGIQEVPLFNFSDHPLEYKCNKKFINNMIYDGEINIENEQRVFSTTNGGYSILSNDYDYFTNTGNKIFTKLATKNNKHCLDNLGQNVVKFLQIPGVAICGGVVNRLINQTNHDNLIKDIDVSYKETVNEIIGTLHTNILKIC